MSPFGIMAVVPLIFMNVSVNISGQMGRKFALDMAGFAVNLRLLHANPQATVPLHVGFLEDGFLRQLHLELDDLEPLASECTEVSIRGAYVC